jgi:hypothetical protein
VVASPYFIYVVSEVETPQNNFRHTEVISSASLPLLRVLLSAKKPLRQVLRLSTLDCIVEESDLACIEVGIVDNTQERWAWAKVFDAYIAPDECKKESCWVKCFSYGELIPAWICLVWLRKHNIKFRNDIRNASNPKPTNNVSTICSSLYSLLS